MWSIMAPTFSTKAKYTIFALQIVHSSLLRFDQNKAFTPCNLVPAPTLRKYSSLVALPKLGKSLTVFFNFSLDAAFSNAI